MLDQIAHFGAGQIAYEARPEIVHALRLVQDALDPRAVGPQQALGMRLRQKRPAADGFADQRVESVGREIAAGQRRACGPWRHDLEEFFDARHHRFRQLAMGGDLAAVNGEQRREIFLLVEHQFVVAGDVFRLFRPVVIERTHAGERPDQFIGRDSVAEILVHRIAEIIDFGRIWRRRFKIADKVLIRGANQRELIAERQREHHALVGRLKYIAGVVIETAAHDDMAAFDQTHRCFQRLANDSLRHFADPGTCRIDQDARGRNAAAAAAVKHQFPIPAPLDPHAAGARPDIGAALSSIHCVEHDQPRIVDPAVGIFEAVAEQPLQWLPDRTMRQIDGARRRQQMARRQSVVQEQPEAQQQRRAPPRQRRQQKAHRPDHMRGHAQQHFAFAERFAHQPECVLLQITQTAMDQLAGRRRGAGAEVVALDKQHAQTAARGVAGQAGSIDAATDNGEVEVGHGRINCRLSRCHEWAANRAQSSAPRVNVY